MGAFKIWRLCLLQTGSEAVSDVWSTRRIVEAGKGTTGFYLSNHRSPHNIMLEMTGLFDDVEQMRTYAEKFAAALNTNEACHD